MDDTEKTVFDALVFKKVDLETNERIGQQVFWKAYGLLDAAEPVKKQGINWTQDDDPILKVKELAIPYGSDAGSCSILLTNMHRGRLRDTVSEAVISVEILPGGLPDEFVSSYGFSTLPKGEVLFTLNRNGKVDSPFDLVDATIADSIVDLFIDNEIRAAEAA